MKQKQFHLQFGVLFLSNCDLQIRSPSLSQLHPKQHWPKLLLVVYKPNCQPFYILLLYVPFHPALNVCHRTDSYLETPLLLHTHVQKTDAVDEAQMKAPIENHLYQQHSHNDLLMYHIAYLAKLIDLASISYSVVAGSK